MSSAGGPTFSTVWTAAGIVVAFAVNVIVFRIGREAKLRLETGVWWLPRADFVLLLALAVTLIGVFVLPVLGVGLPFARYALGLAFVLLAGYPFALAGHYEILRGKPPDEVKVKVVRYVQERNRQKPQGPDDPYEATYLPDQEKTTLKVIAGACVVYPRGGRCRSLLSETRNPWWLAQATWGAVVTT